jgi:hypothetical protein
MADHPIIAVADALATWIAVRAWSLEITVARRSVVRFDLPDLATCQVSVVPADWEETVIGRRATKRSFLIDVAVQQKVDVDDLPTTDALMGLVWEIEQAMKFVRLTTTPPAQWISVAKVPGSDPGYAPQHMVELRAFTAIRRHTFIPEGTT